MRQRWFEEMLQAEARVGHWSGSRVAADAETRGGMDMVEGGEGEYSGVEKAMR